MRKSAIAALLLACCGGCGGGGGSDGAANSAGASTPSTPASSTPNASGAIFVRSMVLGRLDAEPVGFIDGQPGNGLAIDVPAASPLLAAGRNPLTSSYREAATPGVILACISAPTSGTGIVDGINIGVNIKSVAALLDSGWSPVANAATAWSALAGAHFDNWENCGEKPEGRPSLASRMSVDAAGGYAEDVYDGNFGTNLNIISLRYDAAQVAAMLSPQGWLNPGRGSGAKRIWLQIWRNAAGATLLLQQGWPEGGGAEAGYLALYFQR